MTHHYEPTEDEIRQRAKEIQERWSKSEEEKRRVGCRDRPVEITETDSPKFETKAIGFI